MIDPLGLLTSGDGEGQPNRRIRFDSGNDDPVVSEGHWHRFIVGRHPQVLCRHPTVAVYPQILAPRRSDADSTLLGQTAGQLDPAAITLVALLVRE